MNIEVIGHRGARGLMPENSLPGFEAAFRLGVDAIELDVGVSADHEVIVYHDLRLNPQITRDSYGQWIDSPGPKISDLTIDELKSYDIGRINPRTKYFREFPHQKALNDIRIPTLGELIDLTNKLEFKGRIYIEAKRPSSQPSMTVDLETFAEVLVSSVQRFGITSNVIIKSFDRNLLEQIQQINSNILLSPITSTHFNVNDFGGGTKRGSGTLVRILRRIFSPCDDAMVALKGSRTLTDTELSMPKLIRTRGYHTWSSNFRDLNLETLTEAKELGLTVITWTVNETKDMLRMIDLGVDGIVTDYPDKLIKLQNQEN